MLYNSMSCYVYGNSLFVSSLDQIHVPSINQILISNDFDDNKFQVFSPMHKLHVLGMEI